MIMTEENIGDDLLGIRPLSKSIEIATKGTVDGVAAFLGRICLPVAEEFGLFLKDRVHNWRLRNIVNITNKAEQRLAEHGGIDGKQLHPRLLSSVLDNGSWVNDDDVQQMWAGLLASSCTRDGRDESNLLFVSILTQITTAEARFLAHACNVAQKRLSPNGLLYADKIELTPMQLIDIWQDQDIHRIDRELDHLRELGVIIGGFEEDIEQQRRMLALELEIKRRKRERTQQTEGAKGQTEDDPDRQSKVDIAPLRASVTPTGIGLHLYVRCQGSRSSPAEYFELEVPKTR
jgi:hypothetical protein